MPYYGEATAEASVTVSQQSTTVEISVMSIEAWIPNDPDYGTPSAPPQAKCTLLKAKLKDSEGNPLAGVTGDWTVDYTPPGATSPTNWFSGTLTTDSNGEVDFGFTETAYKQLTIDTGAANLTITFQGTDEYSSSSISVDFQQEIRTPGMWLYMPSTIVYGETTAWKGYIKDDEYENATGIRFWIYDKTIYLEYSADGGTTWNNCEDDMGNPITTTSQADTIGTVDTTEYNFEGSWTVNLSPGDYLFRVHKLAGSPGVETGEAYSPPVPVRVLSPEEAEQIRQQQMMTTLGIGLALAAVAGVAYYLYKRKR